MSLYIKVNGSGTGSGGGGGGGGVSTLAPVGSAPNANGGVISGSTLTLEPANTSFPGVLTAADWNTFNNKQGTITIGALDAQAANATGLALVSNVLSTQSADATHPGVVNTTAQTFAGAKTLTGTLFTDGAGGIDRSSVATLAIGSTNANVINIGNSGATINLIGTTLYENVTQLQVKDPLITLNVGGGAGSASNSGIELEENSIITGYAETSGDRNSWIFKAPNTAGVVTITPGASGFVIDQGSHDPLTLGAFGSTPSSSGASLSSQVLTLQPADATNPGGVSTTTQTFAGSKTFSAATSIAPGAVGTPGLYLGTDTTTGIYRPGVNQFNIGVSGAAVANFGTSGLAVTGAISATTTVTATTQLISSVATGTAPLVVSSTTLVPNLYVARANVADAASQVTTTQVTTNASFFPLFVGSSADGNHLVDLGTGLTFNPSTNNLSTTTFSGALTGTASGNTTYSANNHGVVLSGSANTMTVVAPVASTTKVLTSGGTGADPTWADLSPSTFGTQTAGTFLAGPTSGSAAAPTFRALQAPTQQSFTSGTSQTYTPPVGVLYIEVEMVGGGGCGGQSGSSTGTNGTAATATTFFNASAGAGGIGAPNVDSHGGAGGTSSVGSGATGIALTGGQGTGGQTIAAVNTDRPLGGPGGSSYFGGNGGGGNGNTSVAGGAASANTGSGGGGACGPASVTQSYGGSGGGSGGYVKMRINSPVPYTYTVGVGGLASSGTQVAGTSGALGGDGAAGRIDVYEYYQ